jgi:hypothetical protein
MANLQAPRSCLSNDLQTAGFLEIPHPGANQGTFGYRGEFSVGGWKVAKDTSMLGTILIIVLILLLLGALPSWPYSTGWGYYPSGGLGLVLIIVVILVLLGRF